MIDTDKIKSNANIYTKGIITGGVAGILLALILKQRLILFTVIGAAAGGYLASKLNNAQNKQMGNTVNELKDKFKNYDI